MKEQKRNEEKKRLLTCLKEEINPKRKMTEEETILETIKLIDKLEAAVCSKKK